MQRQQPPPRPGDSRDGAPQAGRLSTNSSDANLLSHSLQRLSLNGAANTPLPLSPGLHSPQHRSDRYRVPSSPGFPPSPLRRSPSVMSLNRSSSPALGKKSSTTSLRGDLPGTPRASSSLSRRSSFNPAHFSPMAPKRPLAPQAEEKPPLRAYDVAADYFRKELATNHYATATVKADTVVILHDQCYGHRYSRPSKQNARQRAETLAALPERPERLLATTLGVSAAYVRLGQRHREGSHPPHPNSAPPERLPFHIRKSSRVVEITSEVVTNVHGRDWMAELKTLCNDAQRKCEGDGDELARTEEEAVPGKKPFHQGDLYLNSRSLEAFQGALGGVLDAVDAVFQNSGISRAFVSVRPPGHHCSADWPSGFCWLNNVHVGIEHAIMKYDLTHAAIIDFDLHHGDGSQSIAWARNKKANEAIYNKKTGNWDLVPEWKKFPNIGYFSLHDINSFPCEWGDEAKVQGASICVDNAHNQAVWNLHLQTWKSDQPEEFWRLYEDRYLKLLDKARDYLELQTHRLQHAPQRSKAKPPKGAIFVSAGFDASEFEESGMQRHAVNVPTDFYARFTQDIVRLSKEPNTSVESRVISVLEGGYSDQALASGVLSHISGLCDEEPPVPYNPFTTQQPVPGSPSKSYDPQWWSKDSVHELVKWTDSEVAGKNAQKADPKHFSSPTHASVAKAVHPTRMQRTISDNFASSLRAPTPPPPEVDWATAAHALSQLLIPSDRPTRSLLPEELPMLKPKIEQPAAYVDPAGRNLRNRGPVNNKNITAGSSGDEQAARQSTVHSTGVTGPSTRETRASRRKTLAGVPTEEPPITTRSASRRTSIASVSESVYEDMANTSGGFMAVPSQQTVKSEPSTKQVPSSVPSNGVHVKKARSTTATASRIPKNAPPVPRVPSGYVTKPVAEKTSENGTVDKMATGVQRIKLKMPSKEEHDARERGKTMDAKEPTAAKLTRKPAAARATKTATKPTTKKGPSRPSKAPTPLSAIEAYPPVPYVEKPAVEKAVSPPLEQPQPSLPGQTPTVLEQRVLPTGGSSVAPIAVPNSRRSLIDPVAMPLTEPMDIDQLPRPAVLQTIVQMPTTASPPRPDSPPPPPPAAMPQFANAGILSSGSSSLIGSQPSKQPSQTSAPLQWRPTPTNAPARPAVNPLSPASKRSDLPVFSANGPIPFAPNPATASNSSLAPHTQSTASDTSMPTIESESEDIWEVPDTPTR
ncbi:hypothetical protein BDV95DRAFT_601697 [Massariosphaeria phaeospora]|uniref:Histone deacetylase domain-containing protein n=1 Tax=Massariosphaeria phaeospora TaxID=100035 RepID=A0A7C8IEE8_9PLEO|nr:hypothetical protein BDV95DRAFT_601697 [Massariosphaeria phaeospora]